MTLFSILMSLFVFSAPLDVEDIHQSSYTFMKTSNGQHFAVGYGESEDVYKKYKNFIPLFPDIEFEKIVVTSETPVGCGIKTDGSVWCWGDPKGTAGWGVFGGFSATPVLIHNASKAVDFVPKNDSGYICFVDENNEYWCFGIGYTGIWGDGTDVNHATPIKVLDSSKNVVQMFNDYGSSYYIDSAGDVYHSALDPYILVYTGFTTHTGFFVKNPNWSSIKMLAARDFTICGANTNNNIICSGGCAGLFCSDTYQIYSTVPVQVVATPGVTHMAFAKASMCYIGTDKKVYCIGHNEVGEIASSSPALFQTAKRIQNVQNVVKLVGGGSTYCAIDQGKNLFCWGANINFSTCPKLTNSCSEPNVISTNVDDVSLATGVWVFSNDATICFLKNKKVFCSGFLPTTKDGMSTTIPSRPREVPGLYKNDSLLNGADGMVIRGNEDKIILSNINSIAYRNAPFFYKYRAQILGRKRSLWDKDDVVCSYGSCYRLENDTKLYGYLQTKFVSPDSANHGERLLASSGPWMPLSTTSVSYDLACFIKQDATVWCLGKNAYRQIGDGTTSATDTLKQSGMTSAKQVAASSEFACALKTDNTVWCWGRATYGALGNGTTKPNSSEPVQVLTAPATPLTSVQSVHVGASFACALKTDNTVWCWGSGNFGQLCSGDLLNDVYATNVMLSGSPILVSKIAVTYESNSTFLLTTDKKVYACGENGAYYFLGDGTTTNRPSPTLITPVQPDILSVTVGDGFYCALNSNGTVWCSGDNQYGQLGIGDSGDETKKQRINPMSFLSNARNISSGAEISCGIGWDKSVVCMGSRAHGKLGTAERPDNWPVRVTNMRSEVSLVSTKTDHVCALKEDGSVWCWGRNKDGQLGVGDNTDKYKAVQTLLTGVYIDVAVGTDHSCAVKNDGTVWCFGSGAEGQLGNGKTTKQAKPVQVMGVSGVTRVVAGDKFSCALKSDNTVWCWGNGENGELGNGYYKSSKTPKQSAAFNVSYLAAGMDHVCVVKSDGSAHCWGKNEEGKLGVKSNLRKVNAPMPVSSVTSGANSVSLGRYMSCVTKTDGTMACWGRTSGMTFWD